MSALKAGEIADKVVSLVESALAGLERTIASWPAEFRVIIWEAVADTAQKRADMARKS